MNDLTRLSLNQASIQQWTLAQAIEGCARHNVPYIGVWRDKLGAQPLSATQTQLSDAGVRVSSLCRGGFFSAPSPQARAAAIDDNRRAIADCAAIGSPLLVLVCGPAQEQTLADARSTVRDGIAELAPFAAQHGVHLGIEPLHPMYAAERSVITTLRESNRLAETIHHPNVGLVVDTFHVWWDVDVQIEIERASPHLLGYHVSDWLVPLPEMLLGRGLMGDGVIDIRSLTSTVNAAGYTGPIEVEIFNRALWDTDPELAIRSIIDRFQSYV